jgi:hypothetical protein
MLARRLIADGHPEKAADWPRFHRRPGLAQIARATVGLRRSAHHGDEKICLSEICEWLIEAGRPDLKRAKSFDPPTGGGRYEAARTNSAAPIKDAKAMPCFSGT